MYSFLQRKTSFFKYSKVFLEYLKNFDFSLILKLSYINFFFKNGQKKQLSNKVKYEYLSKKFSYLIDKYKNAQTTHQQNDGPIWVCWWQGEDQMPPIVKMCYRQLLRMAPKSRSVILITKFNYHQYITLPNYILKLVENKTITITHLSDIIRLNLLSLYGGLWIDSTVFISRQLEEDIFNLPYFSASPPYQSQYINRCVYTGFLIGSTKNSPWINFAKDMLMDYWTKRSILIDYSLIDYALIIPYDNIPKIKKEANKGLIKTDKMFLLEKLCNEPFQDILFQKTIKECQFFKLSYKIPWVNKTKDGKETFYGYLIKHF